MSILADSWHDPSGPIRVPESPTAQDAVDFIRRGYLEALDDRFRKAARAVGMTEPMIEEIISASQR